LIVPYPIQNDEWIIGLSGFDPR